MKTVLPFSQLFLLGCGVFFAQNLFAQWSQNIGNNIIYNTTAGRNIGIGTGNVDIDEKILVQTADEALGIAHTNGVVTLSTWIGNGGAEIGTRTNHPLRFYTFGGAPQMTLRTNGNLGLGTTNPSRLLHLRFDNTNTATSQLYLEQDGTGDAWMNFGLTGGRHFAMGIDNTDDQFKIGTHSTSPSGVHTGTLFRMNSSGNVGIGTASLTYRLNVNGTIRATEVRVETGWADFVFNDDFHLRPLSEVEKFIREHRHLPDVTPAADIQKEGLQVAKQMTEMMQKIEELTLYILELNKRIGQLETENAALKNK